jgi:ATP-independent RNA helicase DbpA
VDFTSTKYIVLDEADRMLDMGFQEDMEEILAALPEERQMAFFSATFPDTIEEMSERYQQSPVFVKVEDTEAAQVSIEQTIYKADADDKFSLLLWLLSTNEPESTIVFCNLKVTVAELAESLAAENISVAALHGDLEQQDRDRVMAQFRNGSTRVLVATDVAARGIDVADLDMVVNFDVPKPDVYVHRIGRTGRAGKSGLAVSFMEAKEKYKLQGICEAIGRELALEELPDLSTLSDNISLPAKMATLFIAAGRKDKMRPGDILGALTGDAGFAAQDIGKIDILDRFSYVAVSQSILKDALKRLQNGKIKGRKLRVELMR